MASQITLIMRAVFHIPAPYRGPELVVKLPSHLLRCYHKHEVREPLSGSWRETYKSSTGNKTTQHNTSQATNKTANEVGKWHGYIYTGWLQAFWAGRSGSAGTVGEYTRSGRGKKLKPSAPTAPPTTRLPSMTSVLLRQMTFPSFT